jgi:hypothetical protein
MTVQEIFESYLIGRFSSDSENGVKNFKPKSNCNALASFRKRQAIVGSDNVIYTYHDDIDEYRPSMFFVRD